MDELNEAKAQAREELLKIIEENLNEVLTEYKITVNELIHKVEFIDFTPDESNKLSSKFARRFYDKFGINQQNVVVGNTKEKRQELMNEIHQLIDEISAKLLGLETLQYAVYFTVGSGENARKVRILLDHIDFDLDANDRQQTNNKALMELKEVKQKVDFIMKQQAYFEEFNKHYNNLRNTLKNYGVYNKFNESTVERTLPETFEQDLAFYPHSTDPALQGKDFSAHIWGGAEAYKYFMQAFNGKQNDPWYSGGDVVSRKNKINVQVKGFKLENTKNIVGGSTYRSIIDMMNFLRGLFQNDKPYELRQKAEQVYQLLDAERYVPELSDEILQTKKDLMNGLQQNLKINIS